MGSRNEGWNGMLVKICGLTRPGDAEAAIGAGADMLGFVFVPGTPRFVDPSLAIWIRDLAGAEKVGVFRDQEVDGIIAIRDLLGLDRVQLHGEEPDSWLDVLGPETLRRVRPGGADPWQQAAMLTGRCLPLFDPGAGDGVAFDWGSLRPRPTGLWVGIAGGLTGSLLTSPSLYSSKRISTSPRPGTMSRTIERSAGSLRTERPATRSRASMSCFAPGRPAMRKRPCASLRVPPRWSSPLLR